MGARGLIYIILHSIFFQGFLCVSDTLAHPLHSRDEIFILCVQPVILGFNNVL